MADSPDDPKPKKQPPMLVDNPMVAEVFADNIVSLGFSHGNAILTMGTARTNQSKEAVQNYCVVSSRLVIPLPIAVELHDVLGRLLSELQKKGVVKKAPAQEQKTEQPASKN